MALRIASVLGMLAYAAAECPNACSGHGSCSLHDQCTCCRNWQGNDCSQRTCPFGYAHVDSPKGDMDGSTGTLSGPSYNLIMGSTVYPFGTTEQYPDAMEQEGHFYMECSNKGICNRDDGTCECFPGYEGSACQRASCPNDCSGHGTCETIKELAEDREDGDLSKGAYAMNGWASDHAGVGDLSGVGDITYELWDKTLTMGCKCDAGFMGPDCSMKLCRYGVDPLFIPSNYVYSADGVIEYDWDAPHFERSFVQILGLAGMSGQFDLTIYDVFGEKYVIDGLSFASYESGNFTSCEEIMSHFPNDKIKDTTYGNIHHQVAYRGGLVATAYVGGMTSPFCKAMAINQTSGHLRDSGLTPMMFQPNTATVQSNQPTVPAYLSRAPIQIEYQNGIRYEFDYNRGNPGYIKDLFISNVIPEPKWAFSVENMGGECVWGYYGVTRQGEVAEYSDVNKNFDPRSNRFMYSDDNYFQDGHHDIANDFKVTLPGFLIQAQNGSRTVVMSRDEHYYLEPNSCLNDMSCKQYKTANVMLWGKQYQINSTHQVWLEVESPYQSDYQLGPLGETYNSKARVFRPVTNMTFTEPVVFPYEQIDYTNITYGFTYSGKNPNPVLSAYPEKVTMKAKLTQVYQYVSECSGRGTCDRTTGFCQCFDGYSHDNCDTQTPVC